MLQSDKTLRKIADDRTTKVYRNITQAEGVMGHLAFVGWGRPRDSPTGAGPKYRLIQIYGNLCLVIAIHQILPLEKEILLI